ncbi:MAG: TetR/AcrR family transcriptional regulator [Actinomycetes bacterium]
MSKKPKQARSIESTNRMLDAAESLMREGGPRAITIEAVIERSGTSMGSFYARFESREGLFQALHERFLNYVIEEDLFQQLEDAIAQPDLASAVHTFISRLYLMQQKHRDATAFFLIFNSGDAVMRTQGAEISREFAELLYRLVKAHRSEVTHKNIRVASDFASMMITGIALQGLIYEPGEFTGRARSTKQIIDSTSQAVVAYLQHG